MSEQELVLSDEQYGLAEIGEFEPYLFRSMSSRIEFVVVEEEMEELNDFCVVSRESVVATIAKQKKQVEGILSGKEKFDHPEFGDITDGVLMGLEERDIPKWEHMAAFVSRATCLLLLHVFMEKSLKSLCDALAPHGATPARQEKGKSKIDSFLSYLKKTCLLEFHEPEEASTMRRQISRIRNDFAHGDWDDIERTTDEIHIRQAFTLTTQLFHEIEEALMGTEG